MTIPHDPRQFAADAYRHAATLVREARPEDFPALADMLDRFARYATAGDLPGTVTSSPADRPLIEVIRGMPQADPDRNAAGRELVRTALRKPTAPEPETP